MLKIKKLFLLFFYSFSLFFLSFSIFSHTTGQKSAYLIGETDSTAQITLWSPWTATSQTPWIRSYTPSLATISTYHQPPLSFTYHTPYTTSSTLHNQHNNIPHTTPHTLDHMDMHDACGLMQISCSVMQIGSNLVVCGYASITWSLIGAILVYFPYLTPLFDRLVDTWPDGCAF